VHGYATQTGYENIGDVPVTTLHSLALRVLRVAGHLNMYPTPPLVLDDWETKNIFDEEFGHVHDYAVRRREDIRKEHEAFWSTGDWNPANYVPPEPPITDAERADFDGFQGPRTQTYACVLPGQIIRLCVQEMEAGLLDAVALLGLTHLIVDEFQDLNPMDLRFVDHIIQQGATVFVAGDDDQSIYAFRHASPSGIQQFHANYQAAASHQLNECFRCNPAVLAASTSLINAHPGPGRIGKAPVSLYAAADPPMHGTMLRWKFAWARQESRAIAASCKALIDAGVNPREILILLSNQRELLRLLLEEMEKAGVATEHPREEGFCDSNTGRLVLAMTRIVCNENDYISHRALLSLRTGVGTTRCVAVFDSVVAANLNYRDVFYDDLPPGAFKGHALNALNRARATCAIIGSWEAEDKLEMRSEEIAKVVETHYDAEQADGWRTVAAGLRPEMTIEELRDYLWAESDMAQTAVLESVLQRIGEPVPEEGVLPARVRIMTMHGAKGLSARVVFIPGLEDQLLPGPRRNPYAGLVLEAARMLYVSITRARAACIVSFAGKRTMQGAPTSHTRSRFNPSLGVWVAGPIGGLSVAQVATIVADCGNLFPPPQPPAGP
jgi:DNA helicase-2/ATP-dependent DNA helicase PcrA